MPRLLLVEDNEESRDGLSRYLRRKGFEVLVAADGRQGLEAAQAGGLDLVLMDMSLPSSTGGRRPANSRPTREPATSR